MNIIAKTFTSHYKQFLTILPRIVKLFETLFLNILTLEKS